MTNPTDAELREWLAVCDTYENHIQTTLSGLTHEECVLIDLYKQTCKRNFPAVVRALLAAREAARWFDARVIPPTEGEAYLVCPDDYRESSHVSRMYCERGPGKKGLRWRTSYGLETFDSHPIYQPIPVPPKASA